MGDKTIDQERAEPLSRLQPVQGGADSDQYALFRKRGAGSFNYRISRGDLVDALVTEISAKLGLSSMAFCDTVDFAPFDHQHEYTGVKCYPAFKPEDAAGPDRFMSVTITAGGQSQTVDLYTPGMVPPSASLPDIGDVRFIARPNIAATIGSGIVRRTHSSQYEVWWDDVTKPAVNKEIVASINDGTFDGWVYMDGSSYYTLQGAYDFSEAYQKFGGKNDEFSVPALSDFVKMNPGRPYDGNAIKHMPGQTGIGVHGHELDLEQMNLQNTALTAVVELSVSKSGSKTAENNTFQQAQPDAKTGAVVNVKNHVSVDLDDFDMELSIGPSSNKKFGYTPTAGDETYPKHKLVPAQIYIGRKRIPGYGAVQYGVRVTDKFNHTTVYEGITRLTRESIGVRGTTNSTIKNVVVGNDVTSIEDRMFAGFTELVSVNMASCSRSVEVPEECFSGCVKLERFIFPEQ